MLYAYLICIYRKAVRHRVVTTLLKGFFEDALNDLHCDALVWVVRVGYALMILTFLECKLFFITLLLLLNGLIYEYLAFHLWCLLYTIHWLRCLLLSHTRVKTALWLALAHLEPSHALRQRLAPCERLTSNQGGVQTSLLHSSRSLKQAIFQFNCQALFDTRLHTAGLLLNRYEFLIAESSFGFFVIWIFTFFALLDDRGNLLALLNRNGGLRPHIHGVKDAAFLDLEPVGWELSCLISASILLGSINLH